MHMSGVWLEIVRVFVCNGADWVCIWGTFFLILNFLDTSYLDTVFFVWGFVLKCSDYISLSSSHNRLYSQGMEVASSCWRLICWEVNHHQTSSKWIMSLWGKILQEAVEEQSQTFPTRSLLCWMTKSRVHAGLFLFCLSKNWKCFFRHQLTSVGRVRSRFIVFLHTNALCVCYDN